MAIHRRNLIDNIADQLAALTLQITYKNKAGHYDENTNAEWFYKDLLNTIHNTNLVNLNELSTNYPAIDLGDKHERICFQVTSTTSHDKFNTTIDKFFSKELNKEYDKLTFLIISNKQVPKKNYSKNGVEIRITTIDNLIEKITRLDIEKIKELNSIVTKGVTAPPNHDNAGWAHVNRSTTVNEIPYPEALIRYLGFEGDEEACEALLNDLNSLKHELDNFTHTNRSALTNIVHYASSGKDFLSVPDNILFITPPQRRDPDIDHLIARGFIEINTEFQYETDGTFFTVLEVHFSKEVDEINLLHEIRKFSNNNHNSLETTLFYKDFSIFM